MHQGIGITPMDIFHSFNTKINEVPLFTAFFTDIIALLFWLVLVVHAGIAHCKIPNNVENLNCPAWFLFSFYKSRSKCCNCVCIEHNHTVGLHSDNAFIILSLTVLCPFFCTIAHSPYIAIAYLNDGDHASSIFYLLYCSLLYNFWCDVVVFSLVSTFH